jgi:hypothetical protein
MKVARAAMRISDPNGGVASATDRLQLNDLGNLGQRFRIAFEPSPPPVKQGADGADSGGMATRTATKSGGEELLEGLLFMLVLFAILAVTAVLAVVTLTMDGVQLLVERNSGRPASGLKKTRALLARVRDASAGMHRGGPNARRRPHEPFKIF